MGNVRNPVGPLPSSIYWRRRAVVLCLFALVVAAAAWAVVPHGGGSSDSAKGPGPSGSHTPSGGRHRHTPLPSITPGPSTSQTGITAEPGGRGPVGSGGSGGGSGPDGSGGGSQLPPGTSVPDCSGTHATLAVRSVRHTYAPGEKPEFAVSVTNTGTARCKVNFAGSSTVVTVATSGGHHVYSTGDCPADHTPYLLSVPAGRTTIFDATWNRAVSAPDCATPSGATTPAAGGYRVTVAVPGLGSEHTTFRLS